MYNKRNKYKAFQGTLFVIILLSLLLHDITLEVTAQDIHFSQFFFAPQVINPANTGNFKGDWRVSNNSRRQWGAISAFSTFALGMDKQFWVRTENFSAGAYVVSDISNFGSLWANKAYLSGAYHKTVKENKFHGGLQTGFVNKALNIDRITFPDQYDRTIGDFSRSQATTETGFRESVSYLDINVGAAWSTTKGIFDPRAGIAAFHVNMPNESLLNQKAKLPMRMIVHAGTDINFSNKIYATPDIMYMTQNKAAEMIMGASISYVLSRPFLENSVFAGIYTRNEFKNFDALIILAGMHYQQWTFGISYDLSMSDVSSIARNAGSFELSIIYKEISMQIKKFFIPCDRF